MDFPYEDKCKPLRKKLFYLDIKITKKHEVVQLLKDLRSLGGEIEGFLSKDINFVITDRPNWKPDAKGSEHWAPDTPNSTPSPYALIKSEFGESDSPLNEIVDFNKRSQHQTSRGQKLLEQSTKFHKRRGSADVLEISRQWGICILPISTVLKWLEKTKKSMSKRMQKKSLDIRSSSVTVTGIKKLSPPFIKVEDKRGIYRTFYKEFQALPDICAKSPPKSINQEKAKLLENIQRINMNHKQDETSEGFAAKTRDVCKKKSVKENQDPKRKAYCEICSTTFTDVQQHLSTKFHCDFLSNGTNFLKLNEVLATLPAAEEFLAKNKTSPTCSLLKRLKMDRPKEHFYERRKRVVTNLTQKFDQCPAMPDNTTSKTSAPGTASEIKVETPVDEDRIEGSCSSPPHSGFPYLDGNGVADVAIDVQHSTWTDAGNVFESLASVSAKGYCNGIRDSSIVLKSFGTLGCKHESASEALDDNIYKIPVLSPPNSVLCISEDVTSSIAIEGSSFITCEVETELIPANSPFTSTKDSSLVIDPLPAIHNNPSQILTNVAWTLIGPQTAGNSLEEKLLYSESIVDGVVNFAQPSNRIVLLDAAIENLCINTDGLETTPKNLCNDGAIQNQCTEIMEFVAAKNECGDNNDMAVEDQFIDPVEVSNKNRCTDIIGLAIENNCTDTVEVADKNLCNDTNAIYVAIKNQCADSDATKDISENGDNTYNGDAVDLAVQNELCSGCIQDDVIDLGISTSEVDELEDEIQTGVLFESPKLNGDACGAPKNKTEFSLPGCVSREKRSERKDEVSDGITSTSSVTTEPCSECCLECIDCVSYECSMELQPLNLCTRNEEQSTNKKEDSKDKLSARKIRILSDRSVLTLFNSDDDPSEFEGFKVGEKNRTSDLSYVEVTPPSDILLSNDIRVTSLMNDGNTSSEPDDNWDKAMVEFIDKHICDRPQPNSADDRALDILHTDLINNSTDPGYISDPLKHDSVKVTIY